MSTVLKLAQEELSTLKEQRDEATRVRPFPFSMRHSYHHFSRTLKPSGPNCKVRKSALKLPQPNLIIRKHNLQLPRLQGITFPQCLIKCPFSVYLCLLNNIRQIVDKLKEIAICNVCYKLIINLTLQVNLLLPLYLI